MDDNLKAAVILFHKNLGNYPRRWIRKCVGSILNQTYQNFDIFEIDYGGEGERLISESKFYNKKFSNHAYAHNFLLDRVFEKDYVCAFNVNVDDYYTLDRFEKQMRYVRKGYHLISSNFNVIDTNDNIVAIKRFDKKDIRAEQNNNHNIIAHPVVCYTKRFWLNCTRLKPSEIPRDDFELWKRSISKFKFIIIEDILLFYRIHENKVS